MAFALPPKPGPRLAWVLPPLTAAAVTALVLSQAGRFTLEPLPDRPEPHRAAIAAAFAPGDLAPAPSGAAGRDWTLLDPDFQGHLRQLFSRMAERGYGLVLLEGYRTPDRQARLVEAGRYAAQAGRSMHQVGLAADLGFTGGHPRTSAWLETAYEILGEEAEALGLTWGGRWAARDLCHVQATLPARERLWTPAQGLPAIQPLAQPLAQSLDWEAP